MPDWATFTGVSFVVLSLLLLLSRATQTAMSGGTAVETGPDETGGTRPAADSPAVDADTPPEPTPAEPRAVDAGTDSAAPGGDGTASADTSTPFPPGTPSHETLRPDDDPSLTTGALLANVALSQGLFGAVLVGAALYTEVPAAALGIEPTAASTGWPALAVGVGLGLLLYAGNEVAAAGFRRAGVEPDEELRELLAPDSLTGWVVLLGTVLPVIALFEELLFRAALVGVVSTGFAVSPWAMAVVSTVAFALGHGMQGPGGVAVTGALGFVLAAAFVVTGSLFVVVVAHYLVNALEFVVHEGIGVEWAGE
ncbi:CPBP family intramembrane glutamic endopeptidase [Halostella salina]|uniref:CPBP family intramembrane glutamic endopeptidase n=1 Tax=Halostella salina TaxID=1547897 RepID=UPI000EF7A087|nr:CPBP family intramembrane glutamic endopeptidase [Halostella salina]